MDDRPRRIFKYLSLERLSVISDGLIRYSQLGAFNDPFEARPSITGLVPPDQARETIRDLLPDEMKRGYELLSPEVRAKVPYEQFAGIFAAYATSVEPTVLSVIQQFMPTIRELLSSTLDDLVGVLSLSEVPDSLLMWSHYASSHAGFVLGFETAHPYFDQRKGSRDEFRHVRRVVYRDTRPHGPMSALAGVDVFLVKSVQWAYEREWRVLRPLNEAESVIDAKPYRVCLFRYPPDALREVILGARASPETRASVTATIRGDPLLAHVKLKQAIADETHFALSVVDV